ncbi:MAG: hypothetical protein EOM80_04625 [Erysipelotrichia bacterium]|nr:hypothetical protein [Erysipelotrichia bacterium]
MLGEKLEGLLNIRKSEWKEAGFFWAFTFLCWFSLSFGDSVSDALFIKRVGVASLPAMFILCSLFAIPVSVLLTLLHGRMEKRQLTIAAGLASLVAIFVAVRFIVNNSSGAVIGCYVLYFITNLLLFVIPVVLSVLMGTQFNALKGKRLVPVIFTGIVAGRIAAGLSLSFLASRYQVSQILWFWFFMHAFAFIFFFIGSGSFIKPQIQSFFSQTNERKKIRRIDRLRNFLRILSESRLVLFLVLSGVCSNFIYYFAEFQGAAIFNSHFTSENDLARFYGLFTIFASLLAFIFQGMITGNLVQRLGVSNTNIVYPFLVLIAFVGTAFSATLIPGIWLKFVQISLLNALFQPVHSLFYNALPPKEKARIITVSEGVLQPLGTVITGLLLLYAGKNADFVRFFSIFAAVLWCFVTVMMRKPYRDSLLKLLRSSNLDFFRKAELQKLNLDRNTLNLLLAHLDLAEEETAPLIVQLIATNGDRNCREQLVKRLRSFDTDKKIEILKQVALPVDQFTVEFLYSCLDSENNDLRQYALKALAKFPASARLREKVASFLDSDSDLLRRLAAVIVARIGDLDQMVQSLRIIQGYLSAKNDTDLLKGIEILGLTCDERFWVNLKPFLKSPEIKIRLAAANAFEKILQIADSDEHYEIIGRLIKDDSREIRYLALKILARLVEPKWFYLVIEGLSDSSPRNRKFAQEILISHYDDKFSELIMVLESSESSLHAKAAVAGILAVSQDDNVREYLHHFGQRMILQLYEYKLEEHVIARDARRESSVYIRMLLKERAWALTRLIVCLIAPEQNREAHDLFKSLYSSNEELVSNAIEVLQNMGERKLVHHIIPVLEDISLEQLADYAVKTFSLREKDLNVILGKYLNSTDSELKEAAVYTVCVSEIRELIPVLTKLESDPLIEDSVAQTCRWALENLKGRGITLQFS